MRRHRKLGGLVVVLGLALSSATCRDDPDPPVLHGHYQALEATSGQLDLTAEGYTLAYRFFFAISTIFQAVLVSPDESLLPAQVQIGFFELTPTQVILFDGQGGLIDIADLRWIGNEAELDFQLASLVGFARLREYQGVESHDLLDYGPMQATSLTFRDGGGQVVDVIGGGGNASLHFTTGGFVMSLHVPAGLLGENEVNLAYDSRFDVVGSTLLLETAFACPRFGARLTADAVVSFSGVACNVAGQVRRVQAVFAPAP